MTAEISSCGKYRYSLTRKIDLSGMDENLNMLFIMLNPSTADASQDDPTIRRCVSFAKREKCSQLTVVNLFALRATDPKELTDHIDPIGPLNNQKIREAILKHSNGIIVAAWGAHKMAIDRAHWLYSNFDLNFKCLGVNKNGSPKHPLYVKNDSMLFSINCLIDNY